MIVVLLCPSSSFLGNEAINSRLLINRDAPLTTSFIYIIRLLQGLPTPNNPRCLLLNELNLTILSLVLQILFPSLVIEVTLGPKNNAIPRPTTNRSISICCHCEDRPQRSAPDEDIVIPYLAVLLEPCIARFHRVLEIDLHLLGS